jgi:hypothetical protein
MMTSAKVCRAGLHGRRRLIMEFGLVDRGIAFEDIVGEDAIAS